MERIIEKGCGFTNKTEKAKIIIDKNGLRLEDKEPKHQSDSDFIQSFLTECIDMDAWNHSWHMDVRKAHSRDSEERKKVRSILTDKIKCRELEIQKLKDAIQVLGRWHW